MFTCPKCGRTSWHPDDERYGYCGACCAFTGVPGGRFTPPTPSRNPLVSAVVAARRPPTTRAYRAAPRRL